MRTPNQPEVKFVVLGCGVIGLTTALRILEGGFKHVKIVAEKRPIDTTSSVAAAWWYPSFDGFVDPQESFKRQSLFTLQKFYQLASENEKFEDSPQDCGVRIRSGKRLYDRKYPIVWFEKDVLSFRRLSLTESPSWCQEAFHFESPFADMPIFLDWLQKSVAQHGAEFEWQKLTHIQEAKKFGDIVINCTGLGAQTLGGVNDSNMYPLRGQVVVIHNPNIKEFIGTTRPSEVTYILPRTRGLVVCGGTAQKGNYTMEPDPETASAILRRCAELQPEVEKSKVVKHSVGLRPSREGGVRLELEMIGDMPTIHNYGHGGGGMMLSYGCAEDVFNLIPQALNLLKK